MGAQPAGEQPVAVCDMHHVAGATARRPDGSCDTMGPDVDIVLGVTDHRGLAGGAARRMDAHHLLHRHGKHAEGVGLSKIVLHGERKLRQVGQGFQVVGMAAHLVETLPIKRRIGVGVVERPLQPFELQGHELRRATRFRSVPDCLFVAEGLPLSAPPEWSGRRLRSSPTVAPRSAAPMFAVPSGCSPPPHA